jgi:phospholipid-binding lipoprotein MlaA
MKLLPYLLLPFAAVMLASCASPGGKPSTAAVPPASATSKAPAAHGADDLDDYEGVAEIKDPIEPLNRATFVFNDCLYKWVFTPVSKTYTTLFPKPVRTSVDNAYENVKFPVRFVNSGLQGKFNRAGKEAQKFGVNTVAGIGGLFKVSDKIDSLKDVPLEDTGQTFATWGVGHGPYIVLPILGPSSAREAVGLVGDYALNPINWLFTVGQDADDWAWIPSAGNTVRSLPDQLDKYNESKANAIDPYTAVRSTFVQNRNSAAKQ